MNKCLKTFVGVGWAIIFTCLFTLTARASLFELNPDFHEVDAHYIYEASVQGQGGWHFCVGRCPIAEVGWISVPEGDFTGFRYGETDWTWSYELTDTGLSLYGAMSIYTFYEYDPEQPDFADVGDVYMYSVGNWVSLSALSIPPTDQQPAGSVISHLPYKPKPGATPGNPASGTSLWPVCPLTRIIMNKPFLTWRLVRIIRFI